MATQNFAAVDLGADSGRVILGRLGEKHLSLEECRRFRNGGIPISDSLYWDVLALFAEMKKGISSAAAACGGELSSIGVDTWAVDFALMGAGDELLGNPHTYRDKRTEGMMGEAFKRLAKEELFGLTGIQFLPINTLYQLLAVRLKQPKILDSAETFLMMPDLFHFWLTGEKCCEFTNASTTQFYNPLSHDWAWSLLEKMNLPGRIFPKVLNPGTIIGPLARSVAASQDLKPIPVIAGASHDTAAAVMAVPAETSDFAYLSSGTWSLFGAEVSEPIITKQSLNYNFTNEGGVAGTYRFLKNLIGLWLLQECRRVWRRNGEKYTYAELTQMAAEAPAFAAFIDPDHPGFLAPAEMPTQIRNFCTQTNQHQIAEKGSIVRCILESLALKYRVVFEQLEKILDRKLEVLHIVGGGTQNDLLCQFTANAIGRPVIAGPVEATACGNILCQAIAMGHLSSVAEAREVVRHSFALTQYEPAETNAWDDAYERFGEIIKETPGH